MSELFVPAFNFLILLAVLGYFLVPKLKQFAAERHATVQDLVEKAEKQSSQAKQQLLEVETKLQSFHDELTRLKRQNLQDIERLQENVLVGAKAMSARILEDAKSSGQAKFEELRAELKQVAVREAMGAAQAMLQDKLKESKMQEQVIDQCVQDLLSVKADEMPRELKS